MPKYTRQADGNVECEFTADELRIPTIRDDEAEACAKIAEGRLDLAGRGLGGIAYAHACKEIASAIRARIKARQNPEPIDLPALPRATNG